MHPFSKQSAGFTLIELVLVIVLLGILAIGATSYMRYGAQIFQDVGERDRLLASARFSLERLVREIRNSVPNSVRIITDSSSYQCIEFAPIKASSVYTAFPQASSPATSATVFDFNSYTFASGDRVSVFAADAADVYDTSQNQSFIIDSVTNHSTPDLTNLNFSTAIGANVLAQTQRVYVYSLPVSYCINNQSLYRFSGYGFAASQNNFSDLVTLAAADPSDNIKQELMGQNIANNLATAPVFRYDEATLTRNSIVKLELLYERDGEPLKLYHEVHIPNVP